MDKFKEIIDNWYEEYGENINTDTREYYLLSLFQDLKANDFMKKDLPKYGEYIASMLGHDFIDESLTMTYSLIVANEVRLCFNAVYKTIKEVKEKEFIIEDRVNDNDVYEQADESEYMTPDEIQYVDEEVDVEFLNQLKGNLNG